jgi:hypothetical protein
VSLHGLPAMTAPSLRVYETRALLKISGQQLPHLCLLRRFYLTLPTPFCHSSRPFAQRQWRARRSSCKGEKLAEHISTSFNETVDGVPQTTSFGLLVRLDILNPDR